jgi:ParB family chromosome partitioning protein
VTNIGGGKYELVAGERRLRASKLAGKTTIPAVFGEFSNAERMEIALVENLQREDLNPVETAEAFRDLIEIWVSLSRACR